MPWIAQNEGVANRLLETPSPFLGHYGAYGAYTGGSWIDPILNFTLIAGGNGSVQTSKVHFQRVPDIDDIASRPNFAKSMHSQGYYIQHFRSQIKDNRGQDAFGWPFGIGNEPYACYYTNLPMRTRTRMAPLVVGGRRI